MADECIAQIAAISGQVNGLVILSSASLGISQYFVGHLKSLSGIIPHFDRAF